MPKHTTARSTSLPARWAERALAWITTGVVATVTTIIVWQTLLERLYG
jgi:hypothetical protein